MTTGGWPQRFEVRVGAERYRVVTWEGAAKAEALARDAHRRRHPDGGETPVEVIEVDPPARTARGTVALDPHDVIDRMEF